MKEYQKNAFVKLVNTLPADAALNVNSIIIMSEPLSKATKLFINGVTAASLAACQTGILVPAETPDKTNNDPKPAESIPTNESKVTTAPLTEITDATEKAKVISKLPKFHPEAENGESSMSVFKVKAGDKSFNFVVYPLSEDAISEKQGETNPNATQGPVVAMYSDFVNYDGSTTMVRLAGESLIILDENGKPTGDESHKWYYQEKYQTINGLPVDKSNTVLGYTNPGKPNVLFEPSSLMSPNIEIVGYTKDQVLPVYTTSGDLPPFLKVQMMPTKVDSAAEIKQFEICEPKDWRKCEISEKDLTDGTYLNWLRLTFSKPFDQTQIRTDLSLTIYRDTNDNPVYIGYKVKGTEGNFTGEYEGKEPLRKNVTSGYVTTFDSEGREWLDVVLPVQLNDKNNPEVTQWVILVKSFPMWWHKFSDDEINKGIKIWVDDMNIAPILCTDKYEDQEFSDPLVAKTFATYDMKSLFTQFAGEVGIDPDDVSALSKPGIILSTTISGTAAYK